MIARLIRVSGKVQGVWFRDWTILEAKAQGVSGWVRNCPDGTVEAHVLGEEDAVAKMLAAMHQGPSQARVEDFTVEVVEPEEVSGFSVRH